MLKDRDTKVYIVSMPPANRHSWGGKLKSPMTINYDWEKKFLYEWKY